MTSAAQQASERSERAMRAAALRLKKEGIVFPVCNGGESTEEFYARCRAYSSLESRYFIEALQASTRPQDDKESVLKKEWKAYDDD